MPRSKGLAEQGPRLLFLVVATLLLWFASMSAVGLLLGDEPRSVAVRVAAVVIGVAGLLPWMWVVSLTIRAQDEYKQRIHLVALGVAFAATGVFVVTADLLVRAALIDDPPLSWIVMWMAAAWGVSIAIVARLYR